MNTVYCVYKPLGATPLDMVRRLKTQIPGLDTLRVGYAGRLDPMAEGLLLLLVGEENKQKVFYEKLSKIYSVDIVFGFSTDSYDILGLITANKPVLDHKKLHDQLRTYIPSLVGSHIQTYPDYSAKHVMGKPLYYWARHGKPMGMKTPQNTIHITSCNLISFRLISKKDMYASIFSRLTRIAGDFRQEAIESVWKRTLEDIALSAFPVASIQVTCSSGTYMRSLANSVGQSVKIPALAWSIRRDAIGSYTINDAIDLK